MGSPVDIKRRFDAPGYPTLSEIALDLRWSWNHAADEVWKRLDPELWDSTHNPWFVLQTVSVDKLHSVSSDPDFQELVQELAEERRAAVETPGWFQQAHFGSLLKTVAYFRRSRKRSRRPAQDGQQPGRPGDRNRPAVSAGLFSPGDRCAGPSGGAISFQRPRTTASPASAAP